MKYSIRAENLSFRYLPREPKVVDTVSFDVHEGDFIGIIGPNGGGKSTLVKLIIGFLQPTEGNIHVAYSDSHTPYTIGWVPQHFAYDSHFPISVQDVVLSGRLATLPWHGRYQKADYAAVEKALDTVSLSHNLHTCFSHLSGGQMQRVLLARALVSHPKILILDEPTTNIDADNQQKILQILKKINASCTILMVTHDLHHTTHFFNKVFYMNKTLTTLTDTSSLINQFCCHTTSQDHIHA
ncbi:ABC transporter, ATP-binding protein [Chlamydia pecorum PV3056/3]|uniref:metal ABC transporter ATP-binding protein n=1 Tax=Chlamydia pecorum TaxID=85991 RepID=UPI0003AD7780|nr:metal ABC transporter ATP-binding protein [Chlamydia pecorum]AGW37707.1 ABC transporter, ATP-binding protein [Chlamydia pecorum PV3056/3]